MTVPRPSILFASYHCMVDPSSGAAAATRDLLKLLAGAGWGTRVFCGPALDFEAPVGLREVFREQGLRFEERACSQGAAPFRLSHFLFGETQGTIYEPARGTGGTPGREEGAAFLALLDRLLERERPEVMLTYGGHWLARESMELARRRGAAVVFALHNFAYRDPRLFDAADAVFVPSQFAADYYRRGLGLNCTPIPPPVDEDRVCCEADPSRRFVTFVNPQPAKGGFVFARMALELGYRRPDIPLLVVEGRGQAKSWLERTGLDLSGLTNLHRMANTPDPRQFYRVSRAVLMPSLGHESFGLVAAEAMLNGIPVVASDRGALPETIGEGGLLLPIPPHYTPDARAAPAADEVAPWIETIVRLWDDPAFHDHHRRRSLAAAQAWRPEQLAPRYDAFFRRVIRSKPAR